MNQMKTPVVTGRASSIDGRQSSIGGRQSSIGGGSLRPSICNYKSADGKTINPADIANDIIKVNLDCFI